MNKASMPFCTVAFIGFLLLGGCKSSQEAPVIQIFENYITGEFDNSQQVIEQLKQGRQIHPLAIHVNNNITHRVRGLPDHFEGFFLLEESYYLWENKPIEIKPYLFYFRPGQSASTVELTVYKIPENFTKTESRYDNKEFMLDFTQLQPSPTFNGATYQWDGASQCFSTHSPQQLPGGMRFTLIEKFTENQLEVMELLEHEGKSLTPYDTPIIYNRKRVEKDDRLFLH